MREDLTLVVIAATASSTPFYANPYVKAGAILVVAVIILGVALMLFRSSGKKKKENENNATGTPGWQAGQQGAGQWNPQGAGMSGDNQWGQQQGGWGAQNPAQQQQGAWGAPPQQQGGWDQQQGAWGAQNPAQQQGNWGAPPQQQGGWDQQQGAWGAQNPAQQQGAWGAQNPAQAAPAQDPWAQQQQGGWGAPPQQQGFGTTGSGQNWGQPAQQSPAQNAWGAQPQAAGAPAWGQPAPAAQPGFGGGGFEGPDSERTVLRGAGNTPGMPMGGVAPGRMGMIRIEEGKEPGRVYEVRKEALSIGRSRESDIFLEDLAVSRLHASIISQGNGNYALRDEGSANGTKVNGQPVNKYQPYPLQDGDKIQLGQTVLVFGRR